MNNALIEAKNVTKVFKIGGIFFGSKLKAVENVNLKIEEDKPSILTLAGESGSGKTTLARMILGIYEPTEGEILYKGKNIFKLNNKEKREFMKNVQPIFQNPFEAFNVLKKVDNYLISTALNYNLASSEKEALEIINEALSLVGLKNEKVLGKYPHQFSGGELQRVSIARALITKPKLIVADEPVSMVDASLRMDILNLFLELKNKLKTSIIYITHDLSTAYYIGDMIAIMFRGNIIEYGPIEKVLTDPLHPYTKVLIESIPIPDPKHRWTKEIRLPSLVVKEYAAKGCKFANRCPHATERCQQQEPSMFNVEERKVKCWLYASN